MGPLVFRVATGGFIAGCGAFLCYEGEAMRGCGILGNAIGDVAMEGARHTDSPALGAVAGGIGMVAKIFGIFQMLASLTLIASGAGAIGIGVAVMTGFSPYSAIAAVALASLAASRSLYLHSRMR